MGYYGNECLKSEGLFLSAEDLWLWFMYCKKVRNGLQRRGDYSSFRPCELVDVEALITKLVLSQKISREQIAILISYGERQRVPDDREFRQRRDAKLWNDAMVTLGEWAKIKGWVS